MVYKDNLLDGTPVFVYTVEEHAEAEVNKEIIKETRRVLSNMEEPIHV